MVESVARKRGSLAEPAKADGGPARDRGAGGGAGDAGAPSVAHPFFGAGSGAAASGPPVVAGFAPSSPGSLEARATVGLAALVRAIRGRAGKHVVLIRGYPDPDSLASAWAHARIAAAVGVPCDIAHGPVISRPENRAMAAVLELPLVRLRSPEDLARYDALSLVDAHATDIPRRSGLACASIVDHHTPPAELEADFVDLRMEVGSTSTIYASYMLCGGDAVPPLATMTRPLATALAYGIRSDTDDLLHATPDDLRALAYLLPHVDHDLLRLFSRFPVGATAMQILGRALRRVRVIGSWAVAGVGVVDVDDRDAIGQAADQLVRLEGVRTALVFGIVGDTVDGSLRTTDPTLDPATWLREAFGSSPLGVPYGGGRRGKGGFQLPLGPVARSSRQAALWRACRAFVLDVVESRVRSSTAPGESDRVIRERHVRDAASHLNHRSRG